MSSRRLRAFAAGLLVGCVSLLLVVSVAAEPTAQETVVALPADLQPIMTENAVAVAQVALIDAQTAMTSQMLSLPGGYAPMQAWFQTQLLVRAGYSVGDNGELVPYSGGGNQVMFANTMFDLMHLAGTAIPVEEFVVVTAALSPDATTIAVVGEHVVTLIDTATVTETQRFESPDTALTGALFSADGRWLVAYGGDGNPTVENAEPHNALLLIDMATQAATPLMGHEQTVGAVAFSADGMRLASVSAFDNSLRVWNLASGEVETTATIPSMPVFSLAYSPDGQLLAAGTIAGEIHLIDGAAGETLATLHEPMAEYDFVNFVRFSPDGRFLLSATVDGTLRFWGTAADGGALVMSEASEADAVDVAVTPAPTSAANQVSVDALSSMLGGAIPLATATLLVPSAEGSATCSVYAPQNANLRGGPGTEFTQAGRLSAGQSAEANGQMTGTDGLTWYRLSDGAWVRSDVVQAEAVCDALATVSGWSKSS